MFDKEQLYNNVGKRHLLQNLASTNNEIDKAMIFYFL